MIRSYSALAAAGRQQSSEQGRIVTLTNGPSGGDITATHPQSNVTSFTGR